MSTDMENDTNSRKDRARDAEAAAELTAALAGELRGADEMLPPALAAKIAAEGEALVRRNAALPAAAVRALPRRNVGAWAGWLAAAAALLLWVTVPVRRPEPAAMTVAQVRAALLNNGNDSQLLPWSATADSAARGASGDVVWNGVNQRGVMRIAGLAVNTPTAWQYQLWIFDATRNQAYPVDGGVFDIPNGSGEVLIPISARLPVGDAVMFAVTVEKPGGVVVSSRERIVLLAKRNEG